MSNEDAGAMEEGGSEIGPLVQPLVGSVDRVFTGTRLASLDAFRGLAIAVMVLVDNAGGLWPSINHSPWNGITLADFVMPFFLFIVGVALSLTYKRIVNKKTATQKAFIRALKLFMWGVFLQGAQAFVPFLIYIVIILGLFKVATSMALMIFLMEWTYIGSGGVVSFRIAFAYLLVALCEIWAPRSQSQDTQNAPINTLKIMKIYYSHWAVAVVIMVIYLALLYGLYVPDWDFEVDSGASTLSLHIKCGARGDLGPACNAVGYLDRTLLGLSHLYPQPVYRRTPDCSVNSPAAGPLPVGAPDWCKAPFDPEGILRRVPVLAGHTFLWLVNGPVIMWSWKIDFCSSLSAAGSCFLGSQCGHILVHHKDHSSRVQDWIIMSLPLLCAGILLHFLGMPFNKALYSFSYMCFTGGAAGLVFAALYLLVDMCKLRSSTLWLEWLGQNAMLVFALVAASDIFPSALQGFYWRRPENNLVDLTETIFANILYSRRWGKLIYVLIEILFWSLIAGILQHKRIFWKL